MAVAEHLLIHTSDSYCPGEKKCVCRDRRLSEVDALVRQAVRRTVSDNKAARAFEECGADPVLGIRAPRRAVRWGVALSRPDPVVRSLRAVFLSFHWYLVHTCNCKSE